MSRSVKTDYARLISSTRRSNVLRFIEAMKTELAARTAFKEDQTPENLTAWADARHALEEARMKL